jgi:hypothetical protein
MKTSEKNIILVNVLLWIAAILLHPILESLPTSSGGPPKICSLLIPIFSLMLAGASTYLLNSAFEKSKVG